MADYLFIVPGYSDEDFSFLPLKNLLTTEGLYDSDKIQSIEYASLDDQVGFRDFGRKLDDLYNQFEKDHPGIRIDVLAHSTGSLVVRAWLYMRRTRQVKTGQKIDIPVDHLFLFAPANFGSDLAKIGRSGLNAVRVTFAKINKNFTLKGNQDPFETGKRVLDGLEPASPLQWELSTGDLHSQTYFGENDPTGMSTFPFIFAAGTAHKSLESLIVKELQKDGTDSTVRIAGTSLNTRLFTLRSKTVIKERTQRPVQVDDELLPMLPGLGERRRKFGEIAFGIYAEYDHCGIINDNGKLKKPRDPDKATTWNPTLPATWKPLDLLKKAKQVSTADEYRDLSKKFSELTSSYIEPKVLREEEGIFQQFFFNVSDDTEQGVNDFFIQFFIFDKIVNDYNADLSVEFRNLFGANTSFQFHSVDNSHGVLMLDITRVEEFLGRLGDNYQVKLKITAKSAYNGVSFPDSEFTIYDRSSARAAGDKVTFFFPFTTTLVKVILGRHVDDAILSQGRFAPGS
jgi:hypothetical protein